MTAYESFLTTLDRNSASPDDDDLIGQIDFRGRDVSANDLVFARIATQIVDAATGSADSKIAISTMLGSSLIEAVSISEFGEMTVRSDIITTNGHVEIGSTSGGEDLRFTDSGTLKGRIAMLDGVLTYDADPSGVEASSAHIFEVDAVEIFRASSTGVGVFENDPQAELHVSAATPEIRVEDSDGTNQYLSVLESAGAGIIQVRNGSNYGNFQIRQFDGTTVATRFQIDTVGRISINAAPFGGMLNIQNDASFGAFGQVAVFRASDTADGGDWARIDMIGADVADANAFILYQQQDSSGNANIRNLYDDKTIVINQDGSSGDIQMQIAGASRFTVLDAGVALGGPGAPLLATGTGSPEGVVTAPVGSMYSRQDGGTGTTLYVKESGAGNTGWAAK